MQRSRLLLDEQPLQVLPGLAAKLGLNRALFLQQLHYWLQKDSAHSQEGRKWVYNTYEEWHEQFPFWTAEAIRKIVSQLENNGIIQTTTRYNKRRADRTKWYTIDYDVLNTLLERPDESTQTLNQPDKSTEGPDESTDQPDKSTQRYQRLPETNNRDSVLQTGEPSKTNGSAPKVKPVSAKSFGIKRLVDAINAAKAKGKKPAPPDEPYKKRLGDRYAALLTDGYDPEQLEPALEYLVKAACGEGPGWMKGKKLWRFLDEGVSYSETGSVEEWSPDEVINPHGEKGTQARQKAYGVDWYDVATEYQHPIEHIKQLHASGLTHEQMCRELGV